MDAPKTYPEGTPFTGVIGRTSNESVPATPSVIQSTLTAAGLQIGGLCRRTDTIFCTCLEEWMNVRQEKRPLPQWALFHLSCHPAQSE
jgi:hypothetical protein